MATLAASAVSRNGSWYEGSHVGSKRKVVDATLTLTGQGGLSNTILASLFGLSKITDVRAARDSSSNPISAYPSYNGASVVIGSRAAPTANTYVVTGLSATGDITATGAAATDVVESVIDLTTPAKLTSAHFTPGTNKFTQASGAGNLSAKSLLITTRSAPTGIPTDITATVRLLVIGTE